MDPDDRTYFQHRAEVETKMAERATDPSAVQAHYRLAEAYLDKLFSSSRANAGSEKSLLNSDPPGRRTGT
ncbi:hypothetical protein [Sphingomonas qomolangmaensis]|uniref:Uncharacterized protein n=1 Tax=Sphingomonas qomolangmaensis TaxID=2918765 RepID=A0ABY5L960_9SPHN|nr:hypothetical protein [Sphingomonas qomolangmaensis]UUL82511.1 hypothetical protein NMP03_15285 [Sphingomonas qomolangmaensis]